MVAIVSGNGLGLLNSSAGVLGQLGVAGAAVQGNSKEAAYLNIFNGNLALTDSDDFLASRGVNVALTRTYNAQGMLNNGNGSAWQYGLNRQVNGLTGTANAAGSTVLRTAGDGSVARYVYDATKLAYVTTDGGGASQSITYNATSKEWTWRGDRNDLLGTVEIYDANNDGRLVAIKDKVGVRQSFQYNAAGRLSQITDATDAVDANGNLIAVGTVGGTGNDQTYFDYDAAGNLSQIRTEMAGGTSVVRARYEYDALNRLTKAGIDLTPEDGSVADGKLYQTIYTYDGDSARVESITQSDGSVQRFTYELGVKGAWQVKSFTDALGRKTTLDYSVPGRTTVTDPLGLVSVYGYDADGRLTDITTPDTGAGAQVARFYYDTKGNVSRVTDPRGYDTTYGYDANGNRVLERDAAGNTITRAYNLVTNQLLAEARFLTPDPDGAGAGVAGLPLTTRYTYDVNGRLHYVISAEGRVTEYRYNSLGELASELRYNSLYPSLSSLGALAAPTDAQAVANVVSTLFDKTKVARVDYGYDARGLRASATRYANTSATGDGLLDGMQSTTRYFYDQAGNLLKTLDGNGNESTVSYDGLGRALTRTDSLGNTVVNSYDAKSNLTVTVKAANGTTPISVTRQVRDAAGQLLSVRQDYGQQSGTVSYVYDTDGRLRQTTSATGQKTYWLYDAAGRKVAQIEHNGSLTEYVYNAANQVVKTIAYTNLADLSLLNDAQGNPLNVELATLRPAADPAAPNRASWNGYDAAGRLVASVDVNGHLTRLVYDGASRLVQTTYRFKTIDVALLDTAGIAASYTGEASADDRFSRTIYDGDGKVVAQLDAAGYLTENKYNAAGLLIDAITYDDLTVVANRATGTLATLRPGNDAVNDVHQRYIYNGQQQVVGTIDGDNYLTELTYDAAGNVASRRRYAVAVTAPAGLTLTTIGKTVSADDRVTTYSYDERNQLVRESTLGGTFVEYGYDAAGNLVSRVSGAGITADRSLARYDGAGHVIAELTREGAAKLAALGANPPANAVEQIWATSALHYTYNGAGQRQSASDALGNRTLYFYDKMGRQTITVDAAGTVREQQYDDEGLLVKTVQYAKLMDAATLATLGGGAITGAVGTALLKLADVSLDRASVFYYDNSGRLVYSVDAAGQVSGQSYDAYSQVSQRVQYNIKYNDLQLRALKGGRGGDALGELAGIPNNAEGNARSLYYYDANGRLTYTVNAMGEVNAQTYDGIGRLIQVSRYGAALLPTVLSTLTGNSADVAKLTALGAKANVATQYDRRGHVVDVRDAMLGHIATDYNAFGEVKSRAQLATANSFATSALDISSRTLYDLAGRVLATIDGGGALTMYRYDSAGRLAERTAYATRMAAADATSATAATVATLAAKLVATGAQASDQRVRYFYDAGGRVGATATLQRTGATEEWSVVAQRYDGNGNVLARTAYATALKVTDPDAAAVAALAGTTSDAVTHYAYDKLNRLVATAQAQILASDGNNAWGVTTVTYDAQGNVASRTQYANMAYGDAPLANLDTSKYANPAVDRTTRYAYDALDRLIYTIDGVGAVSGIVYDNLGRPAQVTAYAEPSTLIGPIGKNFAPVATAAADRVSRTIYNLAGQPVYDIDATGAVSERRYDAYGNVAARVRYATVLAPAARATLSATSSPADLKKLLTVSSLTDRIERFVYDLNGQLRFEVDAAGYFKETRYNALGQVVLTASYQTPKVFTEAGLATELAGQVSVQGADTVLENRPRITSYVYDVQGNLLSRTEPMLGKQDYTYDALGRKLSMTNALGKTWTYGYDAAGRNIQENSPTFTAYQDAASTAMGGWGAGAGATLVTTLVYDALGNLTSRTEGAYTAQARTTSYEYDRVGRQKATIMPTTMVYDATAPADGNGRTEVAVTPVIRVWYDALGNAIVNQGADGAISQKAYDQMGRVAYDIDALRYATGYQRNAFGEAIALTRYNLKQNVNAWAGAKQTGETLLRDPANDRTIVTRYDLGGRAVKIIEPATTIYDPRASGNRYLSAARTTETTYNGLGDVTAQQIYGADTDGKRLTEAAATRYYYDARGLKTAQVNVLSDTPTLRTGYLSTFVYNDIGKLTRQTDFSAAVTLTDTGYAPGAATDKLNRNTQYAYDKNGNLTSETKVGVDYVTAAGAAVVNGSLVTKYAYDALDRQVSVTNALNQVTNTYYDELGRISAVSKQLTATTAQLTEFKRDIHGNALLRIDYAQAATTASGGSVTVAPTVVGATDPANRVTATSFDVNGRAIRVLDAEQYANRADAKATFSSYDMYGHLVRQWRTVTGAGVARTAWQLNAYDLLGRQIWTQSPGNINLVDNTTGPETRKVNFYNAFGEVTETRLVLPLTEQNHQGIQLGLTKYDQAGHAWFSNAADGIDTVFLYDAQGNVTARIRSTNPDAQSHHLMLFSNAMDTLRLDDLERTELQYDLLGRLVDSRLAGEQNSVLRWQNGVWVKSTMDYSEWVTDSVIVIGRRDDVGKNFAVRYRLKPDGAWVNAGGSRVQTVDGYPAFSTGGMASGDYEYQVLVQPAGETQYLASTGALRIAATDSAEKDRQVVAMYMLLLGRTPAAPELNYWVNAFNNGATMTEIAGKIYVDAEATQYRAGSNANAVRLLFQAAGRPQPADADYNANLAAWTARLDQAAATVDVLARTTAIGQVLGTLVFTSLPAVALRASAVSNYLVRGGSDQSVVDRLLANAGTAPDGAIAEGTRAAQLESQRRQLARLYLGLFSRAPDQGGFDFWAAALAAGTTIESVALDMLKSDESRRPDVLPDSLGADQYNDKFVTLAYTNLMGRAPTAAELAEAKAGLGAPRSAAHAAFLVNLGSRVAGDITDGAPVDPAARTLLFQKTTVALAYAAMPSLGTDIEQLVAVNKTVIAAMNTADSAAAAAHQATLFLQTRALAAKAAFDAAVPAAAATPLETLRLQLARVYAVALNRAPDRGGFDFWLAQLKTNVPGTLQTILGDVLAQEGVNAALYPPSLTDTQFITRVFTLGMGLAAGSTALNNAVGAWVPRAAGQSRAKLMLDIINSVVLSTDPRDQSMRNLLNNKAAVGVTYAVNFAGSDLTQEKAILQLVTDSDISAALQYGSAGALQIAAESALATSAAAKAAAAQTNANITAVQGIVSAQAPVTAAQTAANANPLAAPLLRAAQLYVTMLGRGSPGKAGLDLGGLSAMAQQMAAGATDLAMAQSILDSVEGRGLFPTTNYNPTEFVTQMYRVALGREPDAGGLAFWATAAPTLASRAQIALDMVKAFLTNPVADTNPNKLANQQAQAAFYDRMSATLSAVTGAATASATALAAALASATDADTKAKAAATTATAAANAATAVSSTNARKVLEISRLYVGILKRSAGNPIDVGGLNFWTRARVNNVSLESIATSFLTSDEGKILFAGATTNQAFINQIYQQVLGRTPAQGDNFWLNALNGGLSRGRIAADIITSLTEQTYQAESEYLAKANFNQRVGDVMNVMSGTAAAEATRAANALATALALKNSTAKTRDDALAALNAANALTVEGDPAVIAAKAAAPRGAAFLASANVKPVTELLVGFSRPTDFNSVYALALGGLTGDALMLSAIRPLVGTSLADRPAFFRDLYTKILKRAPDQGGLDWWVAATAGITDPASVAYEFYKGAVPELNASAAYKAQVAAATQANVSLATSMANGYAPAQTLAASQITQKRNNAQTDYNNSIEPARQADTAWQDASSYYAVAKLAPAALTGAGTVQTASVTADKAAAASLAAAALMPGVAASVGLPATTTLADYTARSTAATNLQKALGLNSTLETAQAALARARAALTSVVQNPVGTTPLSLQAAAVTQIYTAVLNRAPTLLELNLSLGSLKNGKTTDDLVTALIAANPAVYPLTMTNDAFVTKVYSQAMGRAPDTGGLRFWSDALNGAAGLSRGALVMSMIRSMTVESINGDTLTYNTRVATYLTTLSTQAQDAATPAKINATLADFIAANTAAARLEATNFDAAAQAALPPAALYETELTQLYVSLLGRSPEPAALLSAISQRSTGVPLANIVMGMLDAPETRQRFAAGISDTQFVTDFYRLGLGRAADPAELTAALALLAGGKNNRGQVVISLIKDLYAYNGNDALKAATRTTFMAKVSTSLERSVIELDRYRAAMDTAAARSADMEKAAILTRMADGTLLGRDSVSSDLNVQGTARTTLDRWGNLLTVSDARDQNWKITYQYNYDNQRIDSTLNALTGTSAAHASTGYDALGRVVKTTDYRGYATLEAYDSNGNVLEETYADGGHVSNTYDLFGNRLTVKRWDTATTGVQTRYTYDHLGHLLGTKIENKVDVAVGVSIYHSDIAVTTTLAQNLSQQFFYDELGRRVRSVDAAGVSTYSEYDLDGNVIATMAEGNQFRTVTAYDAFHHRTATLDANGRTMSWKVDSFGRIEQFTDMGNAVTNYRYDASGNATLTSFNRNGVTSTIAQTYENGLLVRIVNNESGLTTNYSYDAIGNRLTEQQSYNGGTLGAPARVQNNTLVYDMQNRVTSVRDDQYQLTYTYDNNGNRTSSTTLYGGTPAFTKFNGYDQVNRQIAVNVDAWNDVTKVAVLGKTGHQITYDLAGNRKTDSYIGTAINASTLTTTKDAKTTESYSYDAVGRLQYTYRDGVLFDTRTYDAVGRLTRSGMVDKAGDKSREATFAAGIISQKRTYAYSATGQMLRQQETNWDGPDQDIIFFTDDQTTGGYDKMGNVTGYTVTREGTNASQHGRYSIEYLWTDGAHEQKVTLALNNTTTVSVYDNAGNRIKLLDQTGKVKTQFWYDADGHVQSKLETEGNAASFSLIVNGQMLGDENFKSNNILGSAYQPVTSAALTAAPSTYSVQRETETLQGIAQGIWGDAKLWYLIADANGLSSDSALKVGDVLRIPTRVNTVHNDYATFKPYDASEAIGNTAPALPPPSQSGGGCGGVGMLIMVVVAVAVTVFTAGAMAGFAAQGLAAAMAAGAAAGAAGSIASQLVGMAIGAQDGFSWKGVATSALGGAITGGVGSFGEGAAAESWGSVLKGSDWTAVAARAAVSNVVTQGVNNITGLQKGFSWTSVAASYVGAAVGNQVTAGLERSGVFSGLSDGMAKFAVDSASGFTSGLSASVVRGGKISVVQIATDAFGNALGNSLARSINSDDRTFARRPISDFSSITQVDSSGPQVDLQDLMNESYEGQDQLPETEILEPIFEDGDEESSGKVRGNANDAANKTGQKTDNLMTVFRNSYRNSHARVDSVAFIGGSNYVADEILMGDVEGLAAETLSRPTNPASAFDTDQQSTINRSLNSSRTMLLQTAAEIKRWNDADRAGFFNAFGTDSPEARDAIFDRINNLVDLNSRTTINNFSVAPRPAGMSAQQFENTFAYVYPNDGAHTVYVGPRFWSAKETGADSTAGTLIHEMSHFAGTGPAIPSSSPVLRRTIDGYIDSGTGKPAVYSSGPNAGRSITVYGRENSSQLPANRALYHADSFEYYIEHTSLPRPAGSTGRKR